MTNIPDGLHTTSSWTKPESICSSPSTPTFMGKVGGTTNTEQDCFSRHALRQGKPFSRSLKTPSERDSHFWRARAQGDALKDAVAITNQKWADCKEKKWQGCFYFLSRRKIIKETKQNKLICRRYRACLLDSLGDRCQTDELQKETEDTKLCTPELWMCDHNWRALLVWNIIATRMTEQGPESVHKSAPEPHWSQSIKPSLPTAKISIQSLWSMVMKITVHQEALKSAAQSSSAAEANISKVFSYVKSETHPYN